MAASPQILITRFLNQAKAWLGYNETDGSAQTIIDVWNDYNGTAWTYQTSWCAVFISACAIRQNITNFIKVTSTVSSYIAWAESINGWHKGPHFSAQPGDLVVYSWDGDDSYDHIEIVESVSGNTFVSIGGNRGTPGSVMEHTVVFGDYTLYGFIRPNWGVLARRVPWHAKKIGPYEYQSTEASENSINIFQVFNEYGWTKEAVATVCGVMWYESGLNPWRWESDYVSENNVLASTDSYNLGLDWKPYPYNYTGPVNHGYGLNGFTPFGSYAYYAQQQGWEKYAPNFSDKAGEPSDGDAQCRYIQYICTNAGAWLPTSTYPVSFTTFIHHTETDFRYWCSVWLANFGRGNPETDSSLTQRVTAAEWFYNNSLIGAIAWGTGVSPGAFKKMKRKFRPVLRNQ